MEVDHRSSQQAADIAAGSAVAASTSQVKEDESVGSAGITDAGGDSEGSGGVKLRGLGAGNNEEARAEARRAMAEAAKPMEWLERQSGGGAMEVEVRYAGDASIGLARVGDAVWVSCLRSTASSSGLGAPR